MRLIRKFILFDIEFIFIRIIFKNRSEYESIKMIVVTLQDSGALNPGTLVESTKNNTTNLINEQIKISYKQEIRAMSYNFASL